MVSRLPYIALAIAQLWALVEASGTAAPRMMARWSWVLLTAAVPVIGPLLWFAAGRPRRSDGPRRTAAPDDDQDFLRSL